jgi:hypothetical protein
MFLAKNQSQIIESITYTPRGIRYAPNYMALLWAACHRDRSNLYAAC